MTSRGGSRIYASAVALAPDQEDLRDKLAKAVLDQTKYLRKAVRLAPDRADLRVQLAEAVLARAADDALKQQQLAALACIGAGARTA